MNIAVLLSVLKIIGIVILVIFAIILALILIILFVPIRYRFTGDWKADRNYYDFKLDITWFLYLVHGKAWYHKTVMEDEIEDRDSVDDNEGFGHELKVFGRRIIPGKDEDFEDEDLEEDYFRDDYHGSTDLMKAYDHVSVENRPPETTDNVNTNEPEQAGAGASYDTVNTEPPPEPGIPSPEEEIHIPERFPDKLKEFRRFLRRLIKKIFRARRSAGYKIRSIYGRIRRLFRRTLYYRVFLERESTKEALILLRDEVLYKLVVLKPRSYRLNLLYGFEDPALTGKVTGVLSLIFLSAGKRVRFVPDFERTVMEGDILLKGRICVITLVIMLWKLYFNKSFREFYRAVRR